MFGQSGFLRGLGRGVENSVVEPAVRAPALPLKARKGFAIPAHHIGAAVRRHQNAFACSNDGVAGAPGSHPRECAAQDVMRCCSSLDGGLATSVANATAC